MSKALLQERPSKRTKNVATTATPVISEIVDDDKRFLETLPIHNFAMP